MKKLTKEKHFKKVPFLISFPGPFGFLKSLNQKGFSLTEVLIGISILAILLLIAVPEMNVLADKFRLSGATRLVWGDLQNARMTAIKTNGSTTITFNSSTNYSFPAGGGGTFSRDLTKEYPNITVTRTGGVNTIAFTSTGTAETATVTVQGAQGTKTISVFLTGRILIN